jgi:hypothetical protein
MTSASQFRPGPPPAINTVMYRNHYNEVKSLGQLNSTTRTADQSHAAIWWTEFTEGSMNRLARQLITAQNKNLWKATRALAAMNMAMFDGYVNTFHTKFFYNHWRPVTAIHNGDTDGNAQTAGDPTWANMTDFTPPFPTYSSAHSTVCGASLRVLGQTFGNNTAFTMTSANFPPGGSPTRSFTSFAQAQAECGLSRVFLGFHFRYDSVAGRDAGDAIGNYVHQNFLNPAP